MVNCQCNKNTALQMSNQAFSFVVSGTLGSRIHFNESACANEVSASKQASRDIFSDILRIIAVFSVIILHAACAGFYGKYESNTFSFQVCNFYNALVRFCVPVFVMVSGKYLLNPQAEYPIKKLWKKIFRLVVAYLLWSFFYACVQEFHMHHAIKMRECIHLIIQGHYHLWFLFMITGLYIATPILRWIAKNESVLLYFVILSFLYCFCGNMVSEIPFVDFRIEERFLSRLDIQLVTGYSTYFLLGYWLSVSEIQKKWRILIYWSGILSLLFTITANGFLSYYSGTPQAALFSNLYPNTFLTSIALFVFVRYTFSQKTFSPAAQNIIAKVAKYSFGIYLVHVFFLEHLRFIGLPDFFIHPLFSVPLTSIVVFIFSFISIAILDKIPFFKKYAM